jgi:hypothetical protein
MGGEALVEGAFEQDLGDKCLGGDERAARGLEQAEGDEEDEQEMG